MTKPSTKNPSNKKPSTKNLSTKKNSQPVTRYLGQCFRPLACAAFSATAIGLAGVATPLAVSAQNEFNAEDVQLVLERNQELLDAIDQLTKKIGISQGDNPWADYQQQIKSLQSELGDVRGRLGLAERRMAKNASLVDNLRTQHAERVEQLQQQLIKTSNALENNEEESGVKVTEAQAEVSELNEEISQLQASAALREARMTQLKSQLLQTITSKNAEQVAQQQQLSQLQVKLATTTADIKTQQQLIGSLRTELGGNNISAKKLNSQLAAESSKVALQNTELADLQQTNIALQRQLQNRVAVIKRQDGGINRLLAKLGSARDALQAGYDAAQQREAVLMSELSLLQQEQAAGKAKQRQMRMSNRSLQAAYRKSDEAGSMQDRKIRQLDGELASEREQQSILQGHLQETRQIADAAKARNRDFKQQLAELENGLAQAGSENTRLSGLLQQVSDERIVLDAELAKAAEQGVSLQADLVQTEKHLMAAREQEKTLTGFLDETRLVADKAKSRNRELKAQVTQSENDLAAANAEKLKLTEMNAVMSQRLIEFDATLAERTEQIGGLQAAVSTFEQSVAGLQQGNADMGKKLTVSRAKSDSLEKNLSALRAQVASPRKAALVLRDRLGKKLKEQGIQNTVLALRPDNSVTFKIPNELLFVSGSARINKNGRTMLQQLAIALQETDDSMIVRVEGHTDSVPVAEKFRHIFPSNWYLSVSRAANAVDFLHSQANMDPARLAATGYGEFNPLASNATEEGRNRNRRIEIVLMPGAGQAGS